MNKDLSLGFFASLSICLFLNLVIVTKDRNDWKHNAESKEYFAGKTLTIHPPDGESPAHPHGYNVYCSVDWEK